MNEEIWNKASPVYSLKAKVTAFKEQFVLLYLEKAAAEIVWPRDMLAADVKVGDEVVLTAGAPTNTEEERVRIARKILEELVN